MRRDLPPRRTRTQVVMAGAALILASVVAAPVVLYLAKRPKPRPYREELRERNRLATLLDADTEFGGDWNVTRGELRRREREAEAGRFTQGPGRVA